MANFDIQDAEFNEQLRKFEVTDPVHADLINRVIEQLIRNDVALKNVEDMSEKTVVFEEAKDRRNIESGEPLKTLFGKVRKWFSSLGAAAFYNVVNSDVVTEQGFLPDARIIKAHKDTLNSLLQEVTALKSSLAELNSKFSQYPTKTQLNTAIASIFSKREYVDDNVSVASGAIYSFKPTISLSGYTPVGMIGFSIGNATSNGQYGSYCMVTTSYTGSIGLRNMHPSATARIKIALHVLYMKNPLF